MRRFSLFSTILFSSLLAINCSHVNAQLSGQFEKEQNSRNKNQNQIEEDERRLFNNYIVMECLGSSMLTASRKNPNDLLLGHASAYRYNIAKGGWVPGDRKSILYFLKRVPGNHASTWDNSYAENVKFYPNGNVSWVDTYTYKNKGERSIRVKIAYEIDPSEGVLYSKNISFNPRLTPREERRFTHVGTSGVYDTGRSNCSIIK